METWERRPHEAIRKSVEGRRQKKPGAPRPGDNHRPREAQNTFSL